jgi:hypothetical protein
MKRQVRTRVRVAELAWMAVATRRSAELARTTLVKELAHPTSDLAIFEIAAESLAKGGALLPNAAATPSVT